MNTLKVGDFIPNSDAEDIYNAFGLREERKEYFLHKLTMTLLDIQGLESNKLSKTDLLLFLDQNGVECENTNELMYVMYVMTANLLIGQFSGYLVQLPMGPMIMGMNRQMFNPIGIGCSCDKCAARFEKAQKRAIEGRERVRKANGFDKLSGGNPGDDANDILGGLLNRLGLDLGPDDDDDDEE
jgi:hypothetical protein